MISADSAFERVADAAAAAFASAPPYITYRVDVRASPAPLLLPEETHDVSLRTSDDAALVRDADAGAPKPGEPLPLAPTVDALAQWAFAFDSGGGHARLRIAYEQPKQYAAPKPAPGDTVVVASVPGYAISYAPDDFNRIHLEPVTPAARAFAAQKDHFVYRDVWFDPLTHLPSRVVLASVDETLTLDYTIAQTHWLLSGFTYDGRLDASQGVSEPVHIEAAYSDYDFPASVPGL